MRLGVTSAGPEWLVIGCVAHFIGQAFYLLTDSLPVPRPVWDVMLLDVILFLLTVV